MSILPPRPNPFPGLRPFRSDEHHLFFGREEQTAALLQLLRTNRFLAVVGTSGSGKSSLVRAGMIAELHGGTMTQAGSSWEVMVLRPGGSPIENLARAFVEADLYNADDPSTLPRLLATLNRSRFGLVEAMKQSDVFEPGTNLLVVVDQFEELFRFRQQGVDSEETAAAFVNLLLTAGQQAECPIYVTITMRSDYLGDCSEVPGLAEAVNDGEYLIPRLGRDQKRDAIEKPIGVGGAKISPLLVQRLLNDVGDDPDQLPVLQHSLLRMWEVWSSQSDRARPIDFSDFEATGGLASALSNHADEVFDSLPDDRHRAACEKTFKTLTEKGADNRGIRRPTRLAQLQAIAAADRRTVTTVLDAFRSAGVTFLMPGTDVELSDRTVIDLSHESLMRGWQRLRGWVEEEAQSARIFRRLLDTARLWSDGKAGLFRDPDLQIALSWREQEAPNAEWAEQYGGHFEEAIGFLQASNAEAEAERQAKEAARQRELEHAQQLAEARKQRLEQQQRTTRKLRAMLAGLAAVAVIAVTACVAALVANNRANTLAALAHEAANQAEQNATQAEQNARQAEQAQKATAAALVDVEREKNHAEQNLHKAVAAESEAQQAERRSREFRYATDVQLAARLLSDDDANATQIHARLADHDPAANQELAGKEDLRGFEWHYLNRLVEGRATVIDGFEKDVVAVALSPEGELVTLDGDARLQHWDTTTRQQTRPALDLKKGRGVTAQALSRDGRRAALAIGNQVQLVDATTGEENARTIPAQTRGGLVFSPDGRMLITVDTDVGWWDLGSPTRESSGPGILTNSATWRPIARQEFQLIAQGRGYQPLSVSADGLTLAVGGQGAYRSRFSVFRANPATREIARLVDKAGDANNTKRALAISPDGGTIAVSLFFDGAISLYAAATGKLSAFHDSAHPASISAIAFSPDGTQLVTTAMDGSVKVWEDHKRLKTTRSTALVGHAKQIDAVALLADGKRVLTAGRDKTVRLWNLEQNAASLHRNVPGSLGAERARFSPDGTLLALSGESKHLQLRDGTTGEVVAQLPDRGDEPRSDSIAFSPDNRLLAAGFGGKKDVSYIELWDIDRRERLAVMPGSTDIPGFTTTEYTGTVPALAFSPDGKQLVAGFGSLQLLGWGNRGDSPLVVYDVAARRVVRRLEGHRNGCVSVVFSRDGSRMASASYDGTARIWDTATWKELHVLDNPDAASDRGYRRVCDVAFSPDGKLLAMASAEGNVIIWDAATGEQLHTLSGHANEVWCVAFAPNGRTLASGSTDGTIRLWNTATWRELVRLDLKARFDPRSLAFSPDGNRLLAASYRGGGAMLWSTGRDDEAAPDRLAQRLAAVLQSPRSKVQGPKSEGDSANPRTFDSFRSRLRMLSEQPRLHEALEKLLREQRDKEQVQAALTAARANWHASRQEWKLAVEQFDLLKQTLTRSASEGESVKEKANASEEGPPHSSLALPVGAGGLNSPGTFLRTPALLRLATALFHEDRPAEAAMLLIGGEKRRADDGNGNRAVAFGFEYAPGEYPFKPTQVFRGSPAWRAGLRAGDLLLKFNDLEVAAENLTRLAELLKDTTVRFTVQHPGQEQSERVEDGLPRPSRKDKGNETASEGNPPGIANEPQTVELTKASFIQDDVTNLLIEELLAAVDQKLADSPEQAGLLELRAELAGQSSDYERQVADYTAAVEALSKLPADEAAADLARLHRRLGDAHLALRQWQQAADDYAKGITDATTDESVLANQALAEARIMTSEAFVLLGRVDEPHGIRLVDYRDDGATEPTTVDGKDCRVIDTTRGFGHAYFTIDNDFKPPMGNDAEVEVEYWDEGPGTLEIHYDAHENAYRKSEKPVQRAGSKQWKTVGFALESVKFSNRQNGKADFRILATGAPLHFRRVTVRRLASAFEQVAFVQVGPEKQSHGLTLLDDVFDGATHLGTKDGQDCRFIEPGANGWGHAYFKIDAKFKSAKSLDAEVEIEYWDDGGGGGFGIQYDGHDGPYASTGKSVQRTGSDKWLTARFTLKNARFANSQAGGADFRIQLNLVPLFFRRVTLTLARPAPGLDSPDPWVRLLAANWAKNDQAAIDDILQRHPSAASAYGDLIRYAMLDPTSEHISYEWRYTFESPGQRWFSPDFDDSAWKQGPAGFGTEHTPGAAVRTKWVTPDIWIRRTIELPATAAALDDPQLVMHHAAAAEVYINGVLAAKTTGYTTRYATLPIRGEARKTLRPGRTVIAVHCHQAGSGQYIDVGLALGANEDWRRAVEIYSKAITAEGGSLGRAFQPDGRQAGKPELLAYAQLLSRRARAYEELKDYAAASADWARAAGEGFDGAKLLADFANRLVKAEQWGLAAAERGRARKLLEAVLQADPADDPAIDALAQLLLDMSEPNWSQWTALKPAELKTEGGAALALKDDGSLVVERQPDAVTLTDADDSLAAVRIETSPEASAPAEGDAFKEYQVVSTRLPPDRFSGRYVRIDLPGDNKQFPREQSDGNQKMLNLAELQVFHGERNIAVGKKARQSSTYGELLAERAVDGNTDSSDAAKPFAHTDAGKDGNNPWWEVDLDDEESFDRMVVWNHHYWTNRMNHFRVRILDASRNVVFEQVIDPAPNPSREVRRRVRLAKLKPEVADVGQWRLELDMDRPPQPWKRLRISVTDKQPVFAADTNEAREPTWTVADPTRLAPVAGTALAAQTDGSLLVEPDARDSIALAEVAQAAKVVRVETAAAGESDGTVGLAFKEYRAQALGARVSESGSFVGRYVRIDLPGDNKQFPREQSDGNQKMLNLAELQVFHGDGNIAVGKKARQSSTYGELLAERAVDGNTDSSDAAKPGRPPPSSPFAHTDAGKDGNNPWWEVDLGGEQAIDRMVVWNRHDWTNRMNHFRVRILDASRNVVFEQVIDPAPKPSREIACRSFLVQHPPATDADGPRWALLLGKDMAVGPGERFRISTAEKVYSLEQEEAHAEARKISIPVARLAAAYDLNGEAVSSADWFARALDRAKRDHERTPILKELENHPAALAELLERRPDDTALQLTLARSHVVEGRKKLSRGQPAEAQADFQQASRTFTRLLDQNPEPVWTVLKPTEMKSDGGATLTLLDDGSILASGTNPNEDIYTLVAAAPSEPIVAVRLEAVPDPSLPKGGSGRDVNGDFSLRELTVALARSNTPSAANLRPLRLSDGVDSYHRNDSAGEYPVSFAIGGHLSAWDIWPEVRRRHTAIFQVEAGADKNGEELLVIRLRSGWASGTSAMTLGRFRLSLAAEADSFDAGQLRLHLPDTELAALDLAVGKAYAQQDKHDEAAAAFARALDRVEGDEERKKLIEQFQEDQAALVALAQKRPQDLALQLTLARSLAEHGKQALADGRQDEALAQLAQARDIFARLAAEHPEAKWTVPRPTEMASEAGAELTLQADGSIFVSGKNPDRDIYTVVIPVPLEKITAVRLETLPHPDLPKGGSGRDPNGWFFLSEFTVGVAQTDKPSADDSRKLPFSRAVASFHQKHSDGREDSIDLAIDGQPTGPAWSVGPEVYRPQWAVFGLQPRTETLNGQFLVIQLTTDGLPGSRPTLGHFRLSVTGDPNTLQNARLLQELQASGLAELSISLGNARGRQGRIDEAASAFGQALELAADREARAKVLEGASAYEGVLDQLAEQRAADARVQDALARHYADYGDGSHAREAAARGRALYERRLAAEPGNSQTAKELADLLLEVGPVGWTLLKPTEMKSEGGATLTLKPDGSILASGTNPDRDVYTVVARPGLERITAIRLEALPDPTLPHNGPGRFPGNGNFSLNELRVASGDAPVALSGVIVDYDEFRDSEKMIDGKIDGSAGWANAGNDGAKNAAVVSTQIQRSLDDNLKIELHFSRSDFPQHNLGRFRLSATGNAGALAGEQGRVAALNVANPWVRLGAAYGTVGEFDKARDVFARAIELAPNDTARAAAAREAAALGDSFAQLLEQFPDDKALRLGQAKYLAAERSKESLFPAAVDLLTRALADFPDDIELWNMRAAAKTKLGEWQAADADYARVIELESDEGRRREAQRTRAEIQLRLGRFEQGAEEFLEEMFLSPNDFWRIRDAACAQLLLVNSGAARTAAERLWEKAPADPGPDAAIWLARLLTAQPGLLTGENRQKLLDAAKKVGPALTERTTAALHYRLGDMKQAEPLVTKSAGDEQFQALAALLLFDQGKVDEARRVLKGVTNWLEDQRAADPGSAIPRQQGWRQWAVTTAVWREAARTLIGPRLAELDALIDKVDLQIVEAHYGAGEIQRDVTEILRKRLADARQARSPSSSAITVSIPSYNVAFGGDPARNSLKQLKVRYLLSGQAREATFAENSAVTFPKPDASPNDEGDTPAWVLERARLLADAGLYDEALPDLDRLAALKIDSPDRLELHGRVLAALNRADEALKRLNEAVDAGSKDAGVYAARGKILLDQGQTNQARADLERSLELEPTGPAAEALAKVLLDARQTKAGWTVLTPLEAKSQAGAALGLQADGSVLASGEEQFADTYTVTTTGNLAKIVALRLEALPHTSLPAGGPGWGGGNFHLTELRASLRKPGQAPVALTFRSAVADYTRPVDGDAGPNDGPAAAIDGNQRTRWDVWPLTAKPHWLIAALREPITLTSDDRIVVDLDFRDAKWPRARLGHFRLSATDLNEAYQQAVTLSEATKLSDPWQRLAAAYVHVGEPERAAQLLAKVVIDPELARLARDIENDPMAEPKYTARAVFLARLGRWRESADDYRHARQLRPQDRYAWLRAAPVLVLLGDEAAYRDHCRQMVEQFRGTADATEADAVCKACLLRPGVVDLSQLPVKRLREATTEKEWEGYRSWFTTCCALVSYRAGNSRDALAWAEKLKDPAGNDPTGEVGALAFTVRALAEHQLGQAEQARQTLAKASALIPAELRTLGTDAYRGPLPVAAASVARDWLIAEILRREASALITGAPGN